jgi:phasin family protein
MKPAVAPTPKIPRTPRAKPAAKIAAALDAEIVPVTEIPPAAVELVAPPHIHPTPAEKVIAMTKTEKVPGFDEINDFGKANMEALVEANSIFVKGVEEISKEVFSLTKSSMEQAAAATTAMFAVKTLKDLVELNADYTKSQYEKLLANSTRLGELTVKLATESTAPITARAHRVVETVVRPVV